jgi:hypothetical protein
MHTEYRESWGVWGRESAKGGTEKEAEAMADMVAACPDSLGVYKLLNQWFCSYQ